jgi:putative transposase
MRTTSYKRHSPEEIASKLHQAIELSQHGKRQVDIARTLGVSVMTYHRWRSAARAVEQAPTIVRTIPHSLGRDDRDQETSRLEGLEVENARLRRLVINLLLEKAKLEEVLDRQSATDAPARGRFPPGDFARGGD